ncbi:MAG: YraN family protein [Chloroflexota bacterium]
MAKRDARKQTGNQGEQIAAQYLSNQGYRIVKQNWRCSVGEVDLIVQNEEFLVFVEVRTRRGSRFGTAEESITATKQARLVELAQTYLQQYDVSISQAWRIDVIAIQLTQGTPVINHIENAVGW